MSDLSDKAHQLNILWKSGRDKYVSFFAVLGQVRSEIGSEALNQWCITNLRMHINTIARVLDLLHDTDAQREKLTLRDAIEAKRQTDADARAAKAEARQQQKEARQAAQAEAQSKREAAEKQRQQQRRNKTSRANYHERRKRALADQQQKHTATAVETVENPRIKILLTECSEIEKNSRVELGRRYAELQELVQSGQVGKNPATGKAWSWSAWAEHHIARSRAEIYRCIELFVSLGDNKQKDDVDNVIILAGR